MRIAWLPLCVVVLLACSARSGPGADLEPNPPPTLEPFAVSSDAAATEPSTDPNSPSLDLLVTKSMLYAAGIKHGVNPYLVMGLAWWESGWNESAVSSAGAVGIMQVMPATADADGPYLLHRQVDLNDPADNIEIGTAILRANLDRYHGDLGKALVAYYAGGAAVTDWAGLTADERHYAWGVYRMAIAFRDGKGPV